MTNKNTSTPATHNEIQEQSAHKSFLSREFLTWLWFFVEHTGGQVIVKTPHGAALPGHLWIDDRLVLSSKVGTSLEHIFKGGAPSSSIEAGVSLKSGKDVKEIKIGLEVDSIGRFLATLSGDDLSPKSLKLPELADEAEQTTVDGRLEMISLFSQFLDDLFGQFMIERLDKQWGSSQVNTIRQWIQSRTTSGHGTIH